MGQAHLLPHTRLINDSLFFEFIKFWSKDIVGAYEKHVAYLDIM